MAPTVQAFNNSTRRENYSGLIELPAELLLKIISILLEPLRDEPPRFKANKGGRCTFTNLDCLGLLYTNSYMSHLISQRLACFTFCIKNLRDLLLLVNALSNTSVPHLVHLKNISSLRLQHYVCRDSCLETMPVQLDSLLQHLATETKTCDCVHALNPWHSRLPQHRPRRQGDKSIELRLPSLEAIEIESRVVPKCGQCSECLAPYQIFEPWDWTMGDLALRVKEL